MQSDKEKSLSIAYNNQTGTAQYTRSSIQRFTNSSQLATLKGDELQVMRIEEVSKHYE